MSAVVQPSLWDNVDMERGLQCLAALNFDTAVPLLNDAFHAPGDKAVIQKAIEACEYWHSRIQCSLPGHSSDNEIKRLLESFTAYPFVPQLTGFKKALITLIADLISEKKTIDLQEAITAFDLLIDCKNYQEAESMIALTIKQHPGKHHLFYFLAQAQWKNGHTPEANNNYTRALLYHPDKTMVNRIENNKLKNLVKTHGPSMAPAYAWVQGALPFVALTGEMNFLDEEHRKAIYAYNLLKQSEKALQNNDLKAGIRCRKALKLMAPDLYQTYFKRLK